MMPSWSSWFAIKFAIVLGLIIAGCSEENIPPASQDKKKDQGRVLKSRKLVVLTRNASTTYYIGREGPMGFEYDLLKAFSESLCLHLEIRKTESIAALLEAIRKGEGDIAAAGLTRIPEREKYLLFGPTYHRVQQQVVCHRDAKRPRSIKDLPRFKILIIKKSSYEARLRELKQRHPDLTWESTEKLDTEDILFRVWRRKVDCTVADSNIVAVNRRYFPELTAATFLN